jgi:hypothetical protein
MATGLYEHKRTSLVARLLNKNNNTVVNTINNISPEYNLLKILTGMVSVEKAYELIDTCRVEEVNAETLAEDLPENTILSKIIVLNLRPHEQHPRRTLAMDEYYNLGLYDRITKQFNIPEIHMDYILYNNAPMMLSFKNNMYTINARFSSAQYGNRSYEYITVGDIIEQMERLVFTQPEAATPSHTTSSSSQNYDFVVYERIAPLPGKDLFELFVSEFKQ